MSKNTNLSFLTDYITADITNGRIGINNASPAFSFDVTGIARTSTSTYLATASGNVGIGTTSPNSPLEVKKAGGIRCVSDNSYAASIGATYNIDNTGGTLNRFLITTNQNANYIEGLDNFPMVFSTNNTERMRITSGGQIQQTTAISDWSQIISNSSTTSPNGIVIQYTAANKNNSTNPFLYCLDNSATALRMTVLSNGGIANYQANNTNLSDERTKKDIIPIESYWDKFKAIEIVKFKYKDQSHDDYNIGVISQQVESVAPEFVDADGWGDTPEDGIPLKAIYTADLYHATIKVLQEAMIKIEELSAEITILKNK